MDIFLMYKKRQKQIALLQQKFADFTRDEKLEQISNGLKAMVDKISALN